METGDFQIGFVETRLNLEPSAISNVVNIRVTSASASTSMSNALVRRTGSDEELEAETIFTTKNLAAASSIYFRKHHDSPRSFLWRLLDNNTVLSVRAVDVVTSDAAGDATLILNFIFSTPIAENCVVLADPADVDALSVVVLDQSNCLHTFSLRPEIFRRRASLEPVIGDLCKSYSPTGLSGKLAHRMTAVNAEQILIALHDGGLLRLDRNKGNEQPYYSESMTNAQNWNFGVRSFFGRANTAKFGKWNLDYSTVISAQTSTLGTSREYLFTISIDHCLRVWNPQTGVILHTVDMLGKEQDPNEKEKRWTVDPHLMNLVRVLNLNDGRGLVMVYSPSGAGEFKIWKISTLEDGSVVVKDTFPKDTLQAVQPSLSDTWTMADFVIGQQENEAYDTWVLWKNNTTYRVMRHQSMIQDLPRTWSSWELVRGGMLPASAPRSGFSDSRDPTEEWLQLLTRPGRFTKATLETALSIYERSIGDGSVHSKSRNLTDRIASVVGSTAALERSSEGTLDLEQFRTASETHWKRFYRLVTELDKQRGDALSLVYDSQGHMAWIVCADYISAVRECNDFERLCWNTQTKNLDSDEATTLNLLTTAMEFVDSFPDAVLQSCNAATRLELHEESTKSNADRMMAFYEKAAFWNGIAEEDCASVVERLGRNFTSVTNEVYGNIFTHILASQAQSAPMRYPMSALGRKLMVNVVQDNIDHFWHVFFTQLVLLVHMEYEWEKEEQALHQRVNVGVIFSKTVDVLRRLSLLRWLTQFEMQVPSTNADVEDPRAPENLYTATALEAYLSGKFGVSTLKTEPLSISLTELSAAICAPDSRTVISVPMVQMRLIQDERPDIALELNAFADKEPLSVYVQGRVDLALKDFTSAAQAFRKAAVGMASSHNRAVTKHALLLVHNEEGRRLLGSGLANYYSHVVGLFEEAKAYSYVVEFAQTALTLVVGQDEEARALKALVLSRQFNASLALSRFSVSHGALLALAPLEPGVGRSCLARLVERMSETSHSSELVALPFPGMTAAVDDILSAKCRATLDVSSGPAYHQILYAWRIRHNDFRGAASVILDRINKLRRSGEADRMLGLENGIETGDTPVTRQFLLLINALSCVEPKQAWIFSEELPASLDGRTAVAPGEGKRSVVTLADVRNMYQMELDRIAAIQNNDFEFEEGDAMEL